jgi:hypothetical protein
MAWKYPKHRTRDAQPMDLDALNTNFETVVQEMQGNLNEHNWASGAFTSPEAYAKGAVLRVRRTSNEVVPMAAYPLPSSEPPANVADVISGTPYQVLPNYEWGAVMSQTVRTDATILWIMASFQHSVSDYAGTARNGVMYAIRLDGIVLTETITGSGERFTDAKGEGIDGDGTHMPFAIEAIVPVVAGPHTVELVARMAATVGGSPSLIGGDYWMIHNREMITVEVY